MEVYCWSLNYFAIFMDTCLYQFCSLRIYLRFSGSGLVLSDIFTPFTDISHFLALLRYGCISKEVGNLGGKNLFYNMYVLRSLHTINCFNCLCLHVCVYAYMCIWVGETDKQTEQDEEDARYWHFPAIELDGSYHERERRRQRKEEYKISAFSNLQEKISGLL